MVFFSVLMWGCSAEEATRPNILVAIADDWGWPHAGAYGDPVVQTPVFDRVAREGVLFQHAFVSSPSCTPSRAAILTGKWHWRLRESANLWSTLDREFPVYPDLLEQAGYFVGSSGKGWGPGRIEPGGRSRNPAGPQYESFREFLQQRPPGTPFCFWFGSSDPHRPYEEGIGQRSGIPLAEIQLPEAFPDHPEVRGDVADYYWEVQRFDRQVGELLEELEQRGELENTLVVITGDHGMPFPRGKSNLYDLGSRVPLAVRWPGRVAPGRTLEDFVSLVDLAPTFLEAAGVEPPGEMSGKSLIPLLTAEGSGRIDPARDHVLMGKERHVPCQEAPDGGGTPMRGIRTAEYLYIRNFRPDRWPAGTPHWQKAFLEETWYGDIDNGPTKFYMYRHREDPQVRLLFQLAFDKRPEEELYDLGKDPEQLVNVAAEAEYAEIKRRLSERLMEALRQSADPRVSGEGDRFDHYPYYGGGPKVPDFVRQESAP